MLKKVLLVSPFPPSQNPRLLKEYYALKSAGFKVRALYAERDKWSSDHQIPEDFERVGGKVGSFWHFITRVIHKLSRMFLPYEYNYHRVSLLLLYRALNIKADLYIAHELTALPVVVKAAKKYNGKCGFDIEDFHRQESSDDMRSYQYLASCAIEDKYINQTHYITCSSPLISEIYKEIYPNIKPQIIKNVFSNSFISKLPITTNNILSLFWFSQTIGKNRGLECVLMAMAKLASRKVKLTLLGHIDKNTKNYFLDLATNLSLDKDQLIFLPPVEPENIFKEAARHDIGLALELKIPENRNICLTNKIFSYMNAGLAILASDTLAQKKLLEDYPGIGSTFTSENIDNLSSAIENYQRLPQLLIQHRKHSKEVAERTLNWEVESQKFILIVNSVF